MTDFKDYPFENFSSGFSQESPTILVGDNGPALDLGDEVEMEVLESPEVSKDHLDKPLILGPVQRPPPITGPPVTLAYAVERYSMDIRDGFRINSRGRLYAENGYTRFISLNRWLVRFGEKYGDVDLFSVTDAWLKDFIRFLHHQQISLNTVSGLVDNVHAVIGGYITDGLPLKKLTVRVWPEVADAVFNPVHELDQILETRYNHAATQIASEIYVMHSYLGFRVGTLEQFLTNPEIYLLPNSGRTYLRIRTNKTGAIVVVPLKEIVLDILKRRQYQFVTVYYERYYNRLIKDLAREAGITNLVPYSMTIGGKVKEFIEPKYQLMSSHTARRNFATNAYLAGVPVDNIMWITGHKTREAFFRYIRADSLANAIAISGHPFFK